MKARYVATILFLLAATSCSTYRPEITSRPADTQPIYTPHHFSNRDVQVVWQTERTGQEIRLSGTVTNHHNAYMRDLVLTTRLLNEISRDLARETVTEFPSYCLCWQTVPFHVTLRIPNGTTPKRIHINYTYWVAAESPAAGGFVGFKDFPHVGAIDVLL
jgi:hypothetical protein